MLNIKLIYKALLFLIIFMLVSCASTKSIQPVTYGDIIRDISNYSDSCADLVFNDIFKKLRDIEQFNSSTISPNNLYDEYLALKPSYIDNVKVRGELLTRYNNYFDIFFTEFSKSNKNFTEIQSYLIDIDVMLSFCDNSNAEKYLNVVENLLYNTKN